MWIYVKMQFIPVIKIWIFSIITPVFSHVIHIFVETVVVHFIFQDSLINRKFKRTSFIWNRIIL